MTAIEFKDKVLESKECSDLRNGAFNSFGEAFFKEMMEKYVRQFIMAQLEPIEFSEHLKRFDEKQKYLIASIYTDSI